MLLPDWIRMVMHVEELRAATGSEPWQVQLIDTDGLWEVTAPQTLLVLPADLGPAATLLVHRLAYTHRPSGPPSSWPSSWASPLERSSKRWVGRPTARSFA